MYCAELIEVDRLGSGARVSANFHIFALTAVGNVLGGQENCPGVKIPGNMSKGGGVSYVHFTSHSQNQSISDGQPRRWSIDRFDRVSDRYRVRALRGTDID